MGIGQAKDIDGAGGFIDGEGEEGREHEIARCRVAKLLLAGL